MIYLTVVVLVLMAARLYFQARTIRNLRLVLSGHEGDRLLERERCQVAGYNSVAKARQIDFLKAQIQALMPLPLPLPATGALATAREAAPARRGKAALDRNASGLC
jgi:hypothetical protein